MNSSYQINKLNKKEDNITTHSLVKDIESNVNIKINKN